MKKHKVLITLMMTAFVMSTSVVLADESSLELEKIPSPDKIKEYESIKKEGDSLWGIKKEIAKKMREMENEMKKKLEETNREANKKSEEMSFELEKISSPDKIKEYENIKKEGGSLWGVKKEVAKKMKEMENEMNKKMQETNREVGKKIAETSAEFEKIMSPDKIKEYSNIKKEGNSLWGVKKDKKNKPLVKQTVITAEAVACVSSAIDAKDLAITERITVATSELKTAITARSTCQKEAIKSTEKQEESLKKCAETFQETNKLIIENSKKVRETAWSEYKKSLSSCIPKTMTTVDGVTETVVISDGGERIEEVVQ